MGRAGRMRRFQDIRRLVMERPKTPSEIVTKVVSNLHSLRSASSEKATEKVLESIAKYLGYMKYQLFGDEGHEPSKDAAIALAQEVSVPGESRYLPQSAACRCCSASAYPLRGDELGE